MELDNVYDLIEVKEENNKLKEEIKRLNKENKELKKKITFNSWNKGIHEVQRKLQELKGDGGNE